MTPRRAGWAVVVLAAWVCTVASSAEYPGLLELTADGFKDSINKLQPDYDWVLMEFYAHWCPACKAFQPTYEKVAAQLGARGAGATPRVAVARLDCADHQDMCSNFDITGYPTMYLGTPEQLQALSNKELTRINAASRTPEAVIAAIEEQLHTKLFGAANSAGQQGNGTAGNATVEKKAHLQILQPQEAGAAMADLRDIEGATLKSWQYLLTPALLRGAAARQAMEAWVQLQASSHPIQRCRASASAAAAALPRAWPLGAEEPADLTALTSLPPCSPAVFKDWSGCQGSTPATRGYTCGLWQLLHSLAAHAPDTPGAGAAWLAAVRGYAQHFFQCTECAKHFMGYASAPEAAAVASKRDAVLWVWRTHNVVNKRLAAQDAAGDGGDPKFPHVQWPSPAACAACRRSGGEDAEWDEDAVYAFLQHFYFVGDGGVASGTGTRVATGRVKRSGWGDAMLLCGLVAAAVYGVLRSSGQYAVRKAGSRLA